MSGDMQDVKCYAWIKCSPRQSPINHILVDLLLPEFSILLDQQQLEVSNVLLSKILSSVNIIPFEELKVLLLVEKSAHYIASLQSLPVI